MLSSSTTRMVLVGADIKCSLKKGNDSQLIVSDSMLMSM